MTGQPCTVYLLPGLGFDAAAALPLREALGEDFRLVPIDLTQSAAGSTDSLFHTALAAIESEADGGPFVLCGHSMGGKVATLLASRIVAGEVDVFGLAGLVLLAPSPPTPEPMDEERRERMLGWADDGGINAENARQFLDANIAAPLSSEDHTAALAQLTRFPAEIWRDWLKRGSREDVSDEVGVLDLPVIVLAGEEDADLGAGAQPGLLGEVYPRARFVSLPETGHLIAYERPGAVAQAIAELWTTVRDRAAQVPNEWGRLIASTRTDGEVRSHFAHRAVADVADYAPTTLDAAQLDLLRQLASRLVPQGPGGQVDLAARIDTRLGAKTGDGWRPAGLPDDRAAYRAGLDELERIWPAAEGDQDEVVGRLIAGESIGAGIWTTELFRRWFEDVRVDLVQTWLAHPASQARIGYDGFATGGTGPEPVGFSRLAAGEREAWEPNDLGRLDEQNLDEQSLDQQSLDDQSLDQQSPDRRNAGAGA